MFEIRFGVPEMLYLWNDLQSNFEKGFLNKTDRQLYKKLHKTLILLSINPFHNSLNSHEIEVLSKRYGIRVWQSYLENKKPAAGRIFWVYYPEGSITIIGIEPHPNDTKHSYDKIKLSSI